MNHLTVDVTAIIINYNTKQLLKPCVDALRAGACGLSVQIVIVDNASRDGSVELLKREFGDCVLLFNEHNIGFGRANNQALGVVTGRHVLLLNTDAFVPPGSVAEAVRFLDCHPRCGVLGVKLIGRDGELQPSCRYFPTPWNGFIMQIGVTRWFPHTRLVDDMAWDHASVRECDWVPGCFYLTPKTVLDQVGLFDPRFFMYYEEVDHCKAVKAAGWQVVYFPHATVVHWGGESAKSEGEITAAGRQISALQIESSLLYYRKHYGRGGLAAALLFSTLGDAIIAIKWIVRRRRVLGLGPIWRTLVTTWSVLRQTNWARQSTR